MVTCTVAAWQMGEGRTNKEVLYLMNTVIGAHLRTVTVSLHGNRLHTIKMSTGRWQAQQSEAHKPDNMMTSHMVP